MREALESAQKVADESSRRADEVSAVAARLEAALREKDEQLQGLLKCAHAVSPPVDPPTITPHLAVHASLRTRSHAPSSPRDNCASTLPRARNISEAEEDDIRKQLEAAVGGGGVTGQARRARPHQAARPAVLCGALLCRGDAATHSGLG